MPPTHPPPATSYSDSHPVRPVWSSTALGCEEPVVNFDQFDRDFGQDPRCYTDYLVCVHWGHRAARLEYAIDGRARRATIRKGELVLFPAHRPVRWHLRDPAAAVSVLIRPEFLRSVGESSLGLNPDRVDLLYPYPARDRFVERYAGLMLDLVRATRSGSVSDGGCLGGSAAREEFRSLARALVVRLLSKYSTDPPTAPGLPERLPEEHLRRIKAYIDARLDDPLALRREVLARAFGMSPWHFVRRFKASTGMTPHEYEAEQRFEWAKRLLRRNRRADVRAVAGVVGWRPDYMCRVFRKKTGQTPAAYQRSGG